MVFFESVLDVEALDQEIELDEGFDESYDGLMCDPYIEVSGPPYEGDLTVTPSARAQILQTRGCLMNENITIEAIPSNHGLITWNGSVLTVS